MGNLKGNDISEFRKKIFITNKLINNFSSAIIYLFANRSGISAMNKNYDKIFADKHLPYFGALQLLIAHIEKKMYVNGGYGPFIDNKNGKFIEPKMGTTYDYIRRGVDPEFDRTLDKFENSSKILEEAYKRTDKLVENFLNDNTLLYYFSDNIVNTLNEYKKSREKLSIYEVDHDEKDKDSFDYLVDARNILYGELRETYKNAVSNFGENEAYKNLCDVYTKLFENADEGIDLLKLHCEDEEIYKGLIFLKGVETKKEEKNNAAFEKIVKKEQKSQDIKERKKEKLDAKYEKNNELQARKREKKEKINRRSESYSSSYHYKKHISFSGLFDFFGSIGHGLCSFFKFIFNGIGLIFKGIFIGIGFIFSRFWKVILIVGGIACVVGGIIVLSSKPEEVITYNIDGGSMVIEPTCNSKGLYRHVYTYKKGKKSTITNYDYIIPESHSFDETNKCKHCGKELTFDLSKILYTKLNDGNGDYICIYSLLPSNEENRIIPPYIDSLPVKEVHLNIYDPNIGSSIPTIEDVPSNGASIIQNVYGIEKRNDIYVYSSGADECVYYGNSEYTRDIANPYKYCIDKNTIYCLGDFKDVVTEEYGFAKYIVMTGNVEHYIENTPLAYIYDNSYERSNSWITDSEEYDVPGCDKNLLGPIFLKNVKEYKINGLRGNKNLNYLNDFILPRGLELFSIPDELILCDVYINYISEYFKFNGSSLVNNNKEYMNYGNWQSVGEYEGELKTRESTYVENQNINRYYDCYRVENGFRPELVKVTHIKTKDELVNLFSQEVEQNFFHNQILYLDNDIDFNGSNICSLGSLGGVFDGQGHTISNAKNGVMFESNYGTIKNLKLNNCEDVILNNRNHNSITNIEITNSTLTSNDTNASFVSLSSMYDSGRENILSNIRVANCTLNYDRKMSVYYDKEIYISAICAYSEVNAINLISENNTINVNVIADLINSEKTKTNKYIYVGGIFGKIEASFYDNSNNFLSRNNEINVTVKWAAANISFEKTVDLLVGGIAGEVKNSSNISHGLIYDSMAINNTFVVALTGSNTEYSVTTRKIISEIANFVYFNPTSLDVENVNLFTDNVSEGHYIIGQSKDMVGRLAIEVEKFNVLVIDLNQFILPENMANNGWSINNGIVSLSFE